MKQFFLVVVSLVLLTACGRKADNTGSSTTDEITAEVKVYYFHGPQRCKSCLAIEEIARKVVAENFTDPTKVQFVEVELGDKTFSELIDKYEIAWSSLVIEKGVLYTNMTDKGFAMALSDPEGLKSAIQDEINRYLED